MTSPILWLDFRRVPLWTVLANALAEPAMGPLLGLGLCAALVAPVLPPAAVALSWLAGWAAAWIAFCARLVARLPGAQTSSLAVLVGFASVVGVALVIRRLPRWRRRLAVTLVAGAILVGASAWWALSGPPGLRQITGFHDEAHSAEWNGYRSSRLGLQYRVIYWVLAAEMCFQVISVTAHDYRRK